jgi:hypothetical protein
MDTQQVTSAPTLLGNNETSLFNKPQQQQNEKSNLRHQLDDLLFGSVNVEMYCFRNAGFLANI